MTQPGDTLEEAIFLAIWGEIAGKMHTAIPAKVSKYDPSGPSIEAQPVVKKVAQDGTVLEMPVIVSVPVMFPRTNRFHLSFPIDVGDTVLLIFSERGISEFLQSGKDEIPQDVRKFSMTDAIAIPGLFGLKKGSKIIDGKKFELIFDSAKITSDGSDFEMTGNLKVNGKVEAIGDVKAGSISLQTHTHSGGTLASPYGPANPFTGITGSPS